MAVKKTTTTESVEEVTETKEVKAVEEKAKTVKKELSDKDEVEIVSIIPNVVFEDKRTGDTYHWDKSGDVQIITVDTLKYILRNHRGYFKNMVLKLADNEIADKFGLLKSVQQYEKVLVPENYTMDNIDNVIADIKEIPNEIKFTIFDKIKNMVAVGDIIDVKIIRKIENEFGLDLVSML